MLDPGEFHGQFMKWSGSSPLLTQPLIGHWRDLDTHSPEPHDLPPSRFPKKSQFLKYVSKQTHWGRQAAELEKTVTPACLSCGRLFKSDCIFIDAWTQWGKCRRRLLPDWIQANAIHICTVRAICELYSKHVTWTVRHIYETHGPYLRCSPDIIWTVRSIFELHSKHYSVWTFWDWCKYFLTSILDSSAPLLCKTTLTYTIRPPDLPPRVCKCKCMSYS